VKVVAIIPTAGSGTRMQADLLKPFIKIKDKPIFIYTLEALEKNSLINNIVLVVSKENIDEFKSIVDKSSFSKTIEIVEGGLTRSESVKNGLKTLDQDVDIVLVHDGVRPFIDQELINQVIDASKIHGAAIAAVRVKPTIKRVDEDLFVYATLKRNELWEVQTPQAFKKDIILKAHDNLNDAAPTDDAFLVEQIGVKVKVVEGSYKNIKITTKEDIEIAESFL